MSARSIALYMCIVYAIDVYTLSDKICALKCQTIFVVIPYISSIFSAYVLARIHVKSDKNIPKRQRAVHKR